MKKGLFLLVLLSLSLSTTSCSYLVKNIDDLVRCIGKNGNFVDIPLGMLDNIHDNVPDENKSPAIKLEYYDTSYNKQNYNIQSITPEAKIIVPDIPSVKDIKISTQPTRLKTPSENYVNCVFCNGTGKFGNSTCMHCLGSGKVFIQK